jgi:hypothetical protein
MAVFHLYIVDLNPGGNNIDVPAHQANRDVVTGRLVDFFQRVLARRRGSNQADSVSVQWSNASPAPANPWDVIVYLVQYDVDGVVPTSGADRGQAGSTNLHCQGSHTGSEVYTSQAFVLRQGPHSEVHTFDPVYLANFIFHEMMHNKLQRNDAMHRVHGVGIAARSIDPSTDLNGADTRLLAPHLFDAHPQWIR